MKVRDRYERWLEELPGGISRNFQGVGYHVPAVGRNGGAVVAVTVFTRHRNSGPGMTSFSGIARYAAPLLHIFHCFFIKEIFGMFLRP